MWLELGLILELRLYFRKRRRQISICVALGESGF